jgi:hypothetical protein
MKTIRTKVYQFNELTEQAKQTAIEQFSGINVDYEWWDSIYDDAKTIGLKITSFDLDRNRHAKGEFILAANEVAQNIFTNHGEDCDTYKTAKTFMETWEPVFNEYMDENSDKYESADSEQLLQNFEEDFLNDLLEDYSIMLQNECEYLQSDEAIIDTIEANEYDFTKDGNRFHQ